MRHILTLLLFLFVLGTAHAQAPQGIPYQAAARNSSGAVLSSTSISVRFTIRDNTSTGIILYQETHSTTTNSNGMFSVNIGQGTPVIGTFASINWGTNAKFMQVELDPAGGSSYIDMGTQQMMSVPYALNASAIKHLVSTTGDTLNSGGGNYVIVPGISAANTALPSAGTFNSVTMCAGTSLALSYTTTGGVWSSSAPSVATIGSTGIVLGLSAGTTTMSYTITNSFGSTTATLIVSVNPLPSPGTVTGTATAMAGSTTSLSNATTGGVWSSGATCVATVGSTGIVTGIAAGTATISYSVTNSCGSAVATQVVTITPGLAIGDTYSGGKIAYIYVSGDPGYIAGETHGLIAAPSDLVTETPWGCYSTTTTVGGTSTTLGTGAANTAIVSAACGAGTAARLCADLVLNGYSDWYLPSREELQKLYINKIYIGGLFSGNYWSSSENTATNAWFVNVGTGLIGSSYKYTTYDVRPVRSF